MFELRTLGTIDLRGENGGSIDEPLRHSKRVALLAYLASQHPIRLHRRETLVALLWPELDEGHARGMLRHELYALRRIFGPGVIRSEGGEAVGVDGERIWCDARAFDAALDAGCLADALELVRGEFLPGLNVNGGEFDRWLDKARDRLVRRAGEAADRLSARAEQDGDPADAVRWARRWTELAQYDETAWQRLLSALDRAGDRAGALTAYDALAARLRQELEAEPAPETRALADWIRARSAAVAHLSLVTDGGALARPELREVALWELPADSVAPPPVVIALRPVENLTGDASHDALSRRLTDRLAQGIAELVFVEVDVGSEVPGATAVVSATLYDRSGQVEARTRLAQTGEGGRVLAMPEPVLLDPVPRDEDLDAVVARVLASIAAQYDPRVGIPFVGGHPYRTPSWKAFLEFIQGAEAFGAYRFEEAARRLRRAYEIDPGFVKAGIFAAIALAYCGDLSGADALATAAMSAGEGPTTDYERYFGEWFLADLHGRRPEAYRACREGTRLTSYPVVRQRSGREALRMNRPGEAVRVLKGADTGLGWWRNWAEYYEWFGGAFHLLGDHQAELDGVLPGRARLPEALEPIRAETRARAALGEPAAVLDLVHEAFTLPAVLVSPADVAWTAGQELDVHGHAEAGGEARRAGLEWLAHREEPTRAEGLLEVRLLLESGELDRAGERLHALAPFQDLDSLGLAGLLAAAAGDKATACEIVAQLEGLKNPYLSGRHLLHAAGIQVALGRCDVALHTLRRALAAGFPFGVELHALPMLRPLAPHANFAALLRPRG